jgi:purine nucleosidase
LVLPESRQPRVPQASILADGKWPHTPAGDFPKHEAIRFLQKTIRAHPGEVTLLAIGPLTNIAALFTIDPEIPSLLKALVLMGGNFTPVRWHGRYGAGRCEWNIANDPHAAEIVYRARVRQHRSIGIDVTSRVTMKPDEVREKFRRPGLDLVFDMARVWFDGGSGQITFHDPLAAVTIFEPDLCAWARGEVSIVTDGLMEGYTLFDPDVVPATAPDEVLHEVASDVAVDRFFARYFRNFA